MSLDSYKVGSRFQAKNGEWCTVVDYVHSKRVGVVFDNYSSIYWTRNENLKSGDLVNVESKDPSVRGKLFIGQRIYSKKLGVYIVKEFLPDYKAKVEFSDGTLVAADQNNVFLKRIKNPNKPDVLGVGYMGQGVYDSSDKSYDVWVAMLGRCYSNTDRNYIEARVSNSWLSFQNFAKDYNEMVSDCKFDRPQLDKDLLTPLTEKGRGVFYSKETCCLLPHQINTALQIAPRFDKKHDLPCGVSMCHTGKYKVQMQKYCKHMSLGRFSDLHTATKTYNTEKSKYIAELASDYKEKLPSKVHEALITRSKEILNAQHNS